MSEINGPCPHNSCLIAAIRGLRQGLYYGGRVRFARGSLMTSLKMAAGRTLAAISSSAAPAGRSTRTRAAGRFDIKNSEFFKTDLFYSSWRGVRNIL